MNFTDIDACSRYQTQKHMQYIIVIYLFSNEYKETFHRTSIINNNIKFCLRASADTNIFKFHFSYFNFDYKKIKHTCETLHYLYKTKKKKSYQTHSITFTKINFLSVIPSYKCVQSCMLANFFY